MLKNKKKLFHTAIKNISIAENTPIKIESNEYYELFKNKEDNKRVGIYYKKNKIRLEELVLELKNKFQSILYIFSYEKIYGLNYGFPKNIQIKHITSVFDYIEFKDLTYVKQFEKINNKIK